MSDVSTNHYTPPTSLAAQEIAELHPVLSASVEALKVLHSRMAAAHVNLRAIAERDRGTSGGTQPQTISRSLVPLALLVKAAGVLAEVHGRELETRVAIADGILEAETREQQLVMLAAWLHEP